ncbi:MAG: hypothetical protein ACRDYF_02720, partial [Acidimicrobiia bacterium]
VSAGAGDLASALSFSKAAALTLTVTDIAGRVVAQGTGPSVLRLASAVSSGTLTITVSGSTRASFTLTVTVPQR